jgi:hypothetical protein
MAARSPKICTEAQLCQDQLQSCLGDWHPESRLLPVPQRLESEQDDQGKQTPSFDFQMLTLHDDIMRNA